MIPPPMPPPSDVRVEALEKPVRLVGAIVALVVTFGGTAAAAYYGATNKLERVAERTEQVASAVSHLREETQLRAREAQAAVDARIATLERQREQDEIERRKDREEIVGIKKDLGYLMSDSKETRGDMKVLLDRLNASPRTRTARDYPQ